MTFKAAPISTRWLPFLIALAVAAALVVPGGSATAQQPPPDLEALNNRLVGLFELNGVVFTDADQTTGRLVVGVENKGLTRAVEQRLRVLGVSAEMVDIVETPAIHQLATLQDQVRPLAGGLQIRFGGFLCTLGFNAVLGGVEGFVTNSHCTDVQGGVEDTSYYQPLTQIPSQLVGTEIVDPVYLGSTCSGNIFPVRNRVCRWSDSAFAELVVCR